MSAPGISLDSACLASKWGFQDGDCLDDILWNARLLPAPKESSGELSFKHAVLVELVERHLLPLIPDVVTYKIPTHHNPIRLAPSHQKAVPQISVEIAAEEVVQTARRILDRWPRPTESSQRHNRSPLTGP